MLGVRKREEVNNMFNFWIWLWLAFFAVLYLYGDAKGDE